MKRFHQSMLGIISFMYVMFGFMPLSLVFFKEKNSENVIPLESVLAFEASILALLIPIAFFLLDFSNNSETGITKLDMRVVLEKIIESKKLMTWVIIISLIGICWNVFPDWLCVLVLITGYVNIFTFIKKSYQWLTSRTVVVNKLNPITGTFQNKLRMEYINSLQKQDELIEIYGLIFKHGGWSYFNKDELMESYFASLEKMDPREKSESIDVFLHLIEGTYANSTFTFTRPSVFGDFIKVLIEDMNKLLKSERTDDLEDYETESMRILQVKRVMKYAFNSNDVFMGDLGVWNFDNVFWGNVAHLQRDDEETAIQFLGLFLDEYFDQYMNTTANHEIPNAFKEEWHISAKNILSNKVSRFLYTKWISRIFRDDNDRVSEKNQELTKWLLPKVAYEYLGWDYHVMYHIEKYILNEEYFWNEESKKRFWQNVLLTQPKFPFLPNTSINSVVSWSRTDVTRSEEQQHMDNMQTRMKTQMQSGIDEADRLALLNNNTRYLLTQYPGAFTKVKTVMENIKFNDMFEFTDSSDMKVMVIEGESNAVILNEQLKNNKGADELFSKHKRIFLQTLERLESRYLEDNIEN